MSLLLLLIVWLVSRVPMVRDWEIRLGDSFFRTAPAPRKRSKVVLVTIDDQSLQQYGRWPWPRTLLAQLTHNLDQARAGTIGLDILLSEPQSPEADQALRDALRATGRAVIVAKLATFSDGTHWIEPVPMFAEAAVAVGHAHAVLDPDGVCRRFPPRELTLGGARLAFALEVALRTDPQRAAAFLASTGIPATDTSSVITAPPVLVRVPFRRDPFDTISAGDVLKGLAPGSIEGRPVLVGFGSTEIVDRLNTPISPEFPEPGIVVHGQILDSILTGRSVHDMPSKTAVLILLATSLATVLLARRWRGLVLVGLLIVSGALIYLGSVLVFTLASVIMPAGSMLLALVLGPLLVYTADFVVVERSVTQQLLGLRSWLALRGRRSSTPEKTDLSWRLDLLQRLQTELGSLYELHKTLLESTQDVVAIFDEQDNLLLCNRPFSQALGIAPDSSVKLKDVRALWTASEDAPPVVHGAVEEGEVSLGKELYSLRVAPLPPTTLSPGGGTIVTLSSLRTRVERDRARAEALGFIAHELRTPLASIQGFAEMMLRSPDSSFSDGAPETIFRESKRLLALIGSYLDVLRLDAGTKPLTPYIIDLNGIVQQVFDILEPQATAARMRLVAVSPGPISTMGDAPLISGAVLNLVSNAIKYGQPGTDIRVCCTHHLNEVIISVHNLGPAIAPQELPHLFDAYFRASNVEGHRSGWGLGLAFVKRIVEKHGGWVTAKSEATGTLFEVHLPAEKEEGSLAAEGMS
ncbi:MAG TPA: CHASE2 domain-containing protein [Terriglobales bacterium]